MLFSHLIGNSFAKRHLEKIMAEGSVPQVLLFSGLKGVGKRSFALAFVEGLLGKEHARKVREGSHPDVYFFTPEGKNGLHPIASIKQIIDEASLPPFEADKKVYIIEDVERMLPTSSNALLKTLEEPIANTHIVLLSSHPEEILPTLLSRCCRIPFYPIEESQLLDYFIQQEKIEEPRAVRAVFLGHGSFARVRDLLRQAEDPIRGLFIEILSHFFKDKDELWLLDSLGKLEKLWEKKDGSEEESTFISDQMDALLEDLLYWIRDLHQMMVTTKTAHIFHRGYESDLLLQAHAGVVPDMESVYHLVEKARLAIQRSVKPKVIFHQLLTQIVWQCQGVV